jgi:hypothetical protein
LLSKRRPALSGFTHADCLRIIVRAEPRMANEIDAVPRLASVGAIGARSKLWTLLMSGWIREPGRLNYVRSVRPRLTLDFGFIVWLRVGLFGERMILHPCKPGLRLAMSSRKPHLNPVIYSQSQQYARTDDVLTQPNNFWFFIGHHHRKV